MNKRCWPAMTSGSKSAKGSMRDISATESRGWKARRQECASVEGLAMNSKRTPLAASAVSVAIAVFAACGGDSSSNPRNTDGGGLAADASGSNVALDAAAGIDTGDHPGDSSAPNGIDATPGTDGQSRGEASATSD